MALNTTKFSLVFIYMHVANLTRLEADVHRDKKLFSFKAL